MPIPLLVRILEEHREAESCSEVFLRAPAQSRKKFSEGRLEFQEGLNSQWEVAGIHAISPSYPETTSTSPRLWLLMVMKASGNHIKNLCSSPFGAKPGLRAT